AVVVPAAQPKRMARGLLELLRPSTSTTTKWFSPGEHRPDLLAAAAWEPALVTASLEPLTRYRLWSLATADHREIRVDSPHWVVPHYQPDPDAPLPLFPVMLSINGDATLLATSLSSFSSLGEAILRTVHIGNGLPYILHSAHAPSGLEIALAPDSSQLLAWAPGVATRSWIPPQSWASELPRAGTPQFSANGRWLAQVGT